MKPASFNGQDSWLLLQEQWLGRSSYLCNLERPSDWGSNPYAGVIFAKMKLSNLKKLMEQRIAEGWYIFPTCLHFIFYNPRDGFMETIGYPGENTLVYELKKGKVIFR